MEVMIMNKEHLEEIKLIIKNSDYKNHYKLNDYFEVAYIDELINEYEKLTNNWNELEEWLAREYIKTGYEEYYRLALKDLYDKMTEIKEGNK